MKKLNLLALVCILIFIGQNLNAAFSPISISIIPPVEFPPEDFSITGVRASIFYGKHRDVYGIDIGILGNMTTHDFVGVGISGGINYTQGPTKIIGLQLAGISNINIQNTTVVGLQVAGFVNRNVAATSVFGIQLAATNLCEHTTINGFQVGIYNRAAVVNGFQIGLVNRTDNLHGLQIGLVNFHHKGTFAVAPIINFGF